MDMIASLIDNPLGAIATGLIAGVALSSRYFSHQLTAAVDEIRAESARATEEAIAKITAAAIASATPVKPGVPIPIAASVAIGAVAVTAAICGAVMRSRPHANDVSPVVVGDNRQPNVRRQVGDNSFY
jgi:hypothetical protein